MLSLVRWVWVMLAAIVGCASGFFVTAWIGLSMSVTSECDGVCFEELDNVVYAAFAVACVAGAASAYWAWRLSGR
jgi:uncharacterized membrane protein